MPSFFAHVALGKEPIHCSSPAFTFGKSANLPKVGNEGVGIYSVSIGIRRNYKGEKCTRTGSAKERGHEH